MNNTNYLNTLQFSRITDHNKYAATDALYDPLRKVLLRPQELVPVRPQLNPAASQSRVTREFAYITERDAESYVSRNIIERENLLIPVDKPLYATHDLYKVKNNKFMAVDAKEYSVGAPISQEEMQRIRSQGLKEERIVWDFAEVQGQNQSKVIVEEVQPVIRQTKIIKEELKTTYRPPLYNENEYQQQQGKNKYKYNLYSMLDEQVNGGGCGCPANEIIASRNEPQSIGWLS